jgi:pimeloyl-ACP methyl ester carboxylesterase
MKALTFKNSNGQNLSAIIDQPEFGKSNPIVITAHGFRGDKKGNSVIFAEKLNAKNINTFRFDFFGHGESDGDFADITLSEGVDDILCAINYLSEEGYSNISLVGTSFGGACGIIAASKTDKLKSLALRSPVGDYYLKELMTRSKDELDMWKNRGYKVYKNEDGTELRLKYKFFEDLKNYNGFTCAEKITIPTFIVHGELDEIVPINLSEMLVKVMPNAKLDVIEGADHSYSDEKHKIEAIDILVGFLTNKNL